MEAPNRKTRAGLGFALAAIIADNTIGFGVTIAIGHLIADLTIQDVLNLPWGGILSIICASVALALLVLPSPKRDVANELFDKSNEFVREFDRAYRRKITEGSFYRVNLLGDAILKTFSKEGFRVPDYFDGDDEDKAATIKQYIEEHRYLLAQGHLRDAKARSKLLVQKGKFQWDALSNKSLTAS